MQQSKLLTSTVAGSVIDSIVLQLEESTDQQQFVSSLSSLDQKFYQFFAAQNYLQQSYPLYHCETQSVKLCLPKTNTLTDSMLKNALGCEQKLAKSYLDIVGKNEVKEDDEKKKKIEIAKKKLTSASNVFKDIGANTRLHENPFRYQQSRPVVDNQHQAYLKTQLIYLQQPQGSASCKEYFDKHTDNIARKIGELGGIQDTISCMEESLSNYQVTSFKKKQILSMSASKKSLYDRSPQRTGIKKSGAGWVNKSREMRQNFMSRFQIE